MKKTTALLIFLFLSLPLFSHEGSLAGAGKLRVSQTKYFDIIYSEKSVETARILYENADAVLQELAAAYGYEPYYRLPVVITQTVEQFNAYYAEAPYNRIVIYDTAVIDDLAVFSQTILSTFTHELTHALTYNLKSKGFIAASKIFGDAIAAHYITVTNGMAEGATVSYESSNGEGRLNDPYALHLVRQAKIENKFPSYSDVKGASDAYPRNAFYYFNGSFAEYLQRNYGMEKYAEFWYRCVNGKNLTAAGAFKKAYGIKLNKAWKQFEESFEVPQVMSADPVTAGQAKDFFNPAGKSTSIKNESGALYSNLCATKYGSGAQGLYYIDESCKNVFFVDYEQLSRGQNITPQRLFRQDYMDYLSVSNDGRFLTVGYYSTLAANIKHKAKLYDTQNKTWFNIEETNIVSPAVVQANGQYYFVCQKYEPQKYSICVQELECDWARAGKIISSKPFAVLELEPEEVPCDFIDLGDGTFAFIKKAGLEYSVCVAPVNLQSVTQYNLPVEGMKLKNLSADGSRLVFSWATKETLPRLGFFDLEQQTFSLSQENLSGGVYYPVVTRNSQVVYTGQFFRQNKLLMLNQNEGTTLSYKLQTTQTQEDAVAVAQTQTAPDPTSQELPFKPFSAMKYAFEGLFLPVAITQMENPYGFTYFTSLPWYASVFIVSGGYGTDTKSGKFSFEYQSGTGTSLFAYDLRSSFEIDGLGFKQFYGGALLSSSFDFGRRSTLLFSTAVDAAYGRRFYDDDVSFQSTQSFSAGYSNAVFWGPGTYERQGFTFSTSLIHDYSDDQFDAGFGLIVYVPKLLPVTCRDNFTYNLPAKITANLFPLSAGNFSAAELNAEALLFGYDIQRAIPGVSALFINDVIVTLKYTGGFDFANATDYAKNWHIAYIQKYAKQAFDGELDYRDYATVKVSVGFTPNVGIFANSQFRNNFYVSYTFGAAQNLPQKVFNLGLEAKF